MSYLPGSSRARTLSAVAAVVLAGGVAYAAVAHGGGNGNGAAKVGDRAARIARLHVPPPANVAALKQAAAAHPPLVPLQGPPTQAPTGILNMAQAPFPTAEYAIDNRWQQQLPGGRLLQVYAGADAADPSQGLLIVETVPGTAPPAVYRTPDKLGALRIVAVDGSTFTLDSATGRQAVFDLSSRTFTAG